MPVATGRLAAVLGLLLPGLGLHGLLVARESRWQRRDLPMKPVTIEQLKRSLFLWNDILTLHFVQGIKELCEFKTVVPDCALAIGRVSNRHQLGAHARAGTRQDLGTPWNRFVHKVMAVAIGKISTVLIKFGEHRTNRCTSSPIAAPISMSYLYLYLSLLPLHPRFTL